MPADNVEPISLPRRLLAFFLGLVALNQLVFSAVLATMWARGSADSNMLVTVSSLWMTAFVWFGSRRVAGDRRPIYVVGNRLFMLVWGGAFALIGVLALLVRVLQHPLPALAVVAVLGVVAVVAHFATGTSKG